MPRSYTSAIGIKAIIPKKHLSVKKVEGKILSTLQAEGREAVLLLNKTIATWNDPPTMKYEVRYAGGNISLKAGPSGTGKADWKWFWLNRGTRVRYAKVSKGWRSKTKPGVIGSGAGAGKILVKGRKAGAWPGIQRRGWDIIIMRMMRKRFRANIQRAIVEGLR